MIGGGRSNFRTYCAWPVSCLRCEEITIANFRDQSLSCLKCGGADVVQMTDKGFWKGDGRAILTAWELSLTDGHYRCPKCSKFELRFQGDGLLWD